MDVSVARIAIGIPVSSDRAAERDAAFRRLMTDELDRVVRLASLVLGSAVDAEDAVHDAAILAWRRFDSLSDRGRFAVWFDRILVNVCRDRLRAHRRRLTVVAGGAEPSTPDGATDLADRHAVAAVLGMLPPDQQVVLALRYGADLTVPVIAERLGVPEGTVKSRLHHALRSVRAAIDAEERR
jgi:RNA polymerase sigma-70 factor, ECF subfamily